MPTDSTAGRLLLEEALPLDLRHHAKNLTAKNIRSLAEALATGHPEQYRDVMKKLSDAALSAGYASGGYSFGHEHLRLDPESHGLREQLRAKVSRILADRSLPPQMRDAELVKASLEHNGPLQESILRNGLAGKNPLAMQVESGAKGKAENLKALLAGDGLYTDSHYKPIPYPVLHSFSEGLRPHEYLAGAFGARLSISTTKLGTAAGGYLCLSRGTMVRMADGSTRTIESLQVGDVVVGVDKAGNASPTRVSAVIQTGEKEICRHTFRYGRSRKETFYVDATDDHRVLFRRKRYWSVMRDRKFTRHKVTENVVEPLRTPVDDPRNATYLLQPVTAYDDVGLRREPRAFLLGALIGDGCFTYDSRVTIACGDAEGIAAKRDYLAGLGLEARKRPGDRVEYTLVNIDPSDHASARLRAWLTSLGLYGKKSPEKFIPCEVWQWDNESVADFVTGLFVTDGGFSVSKQTGRPVVRFAMTAGGVISGLRDLLAVRFGIHTSPVTTQTPEMVDAVNARTSMTAVSPKIRNIEPVHQNHPLHAITVSNRNHLVRFAQLLGTGSAYARVRQYCEATSVVTESDDDLTYGYAWVGRESIGKHDTYDIEVEHPDHLFLLANGAVVSNSKRLNNMSHRLVVTASDHHTQPDTVRGYPTNLSDPDNEGAFLAHPVGGYDRNTLLTREVIHDLRRQGHEDILVRSPMVGGPVDGGVYSRDVGVRERGKPSPLGDYVGLAASQSLSEPLTQLLISSKHGGGVAGSTKGQQGFPVIDRLFSVPTEFAGGSVHSRADGRVGGIRPAPQGGHYVSVGDEQHYVPTDREIRVKPGDTVEEGDELTDGLPNPREYVAAKGIGEGRRKFVDSLMEVARNSGFRPHRRNVELVTRGFLNHVRLDAELGEHAPGDVVGYNWIEHNYSPRDGHRELHPKAAVGQYLERPVLHYSIGTKVRASMLPQFEKWGVQSVHAHPEPPPFQPVVVRSQDTAGADEDWMTQELGSNLQKNLLKGVHRGATADPSGTSYVPALAEGVNFGQKGLTVGWKPGGTS